MSLTDAPTAAGATVVYLCGYREVHRPEVAVGVAKPLRTVAHAAQAAPLPLAEPSTGRPPAFEQGVLRLLRLDRVSERLAERGFAAPLQFLFVLTQQDDEQFSANDTVHLRPILQRWCHDRGHDYEDTVVSEPPNQLDTAGQQLIGELDRHVAAATEVVLVIGGGPAALQIASHFASFRGARSREDLTVVQLEEVLDRCSGCGTTDVADTRVRQVRSFHGIVGRRSIQHQASQMLERLDLPSAAQLVLASRDADLAQDAYEHANRLARALAREPDEHGSGDGPVERLAAAVDLAEVEWSRPGGSTMEALWYASIAVTELVPDAYGAGHPCAEPQVSQELADAFSNAVEPTRNGALSGLTMGPAYLRSAWPLLRAGPARITTARGEVDLHRTLGIDDAPDVPDGSVLLWYALRVALKSVRNEHAHQLVTQGREEADRFLRRREQAFVDAADRLTAGTVTRWRDDEDGFAEQIAERAGRLEAVVEAVLAEDPSVLLEGAVAAKQRPRMNSLEQLADGQPATLAGLPDREISPLVGKEGFDPRWFAVASTRMPQAEPAVEEQRGRLRQLVKDEVARLRIEWEAVPMALRWAAVEKPLDLLVSFDHVAGSNLRSLLRAVVPAMPGSNRAIGIASQLRVALDG